MKYKALIPSLLVLLAVALCWAGSADEQAINPEVYAHRRASLMQAMGEGIAIFTPRTREGHDFFYLTGFDEEEAICVLIPKGKQRYLLFVEPQNPARTLWTGRRHGIQGAEQVFGADAAFPLEQFEKRLPGLLRGQERVFCSQRDQEMQDILRRFVGSPASEYPETISDPTALVHAMRLIKDQEEIRLLRRAASITCEALQEVMRAASPGMYEYELEAILEYIFMRGGSPRPGFPSIVGSGPNSTILHYETNRRQTRDGDLVLMDVGAEYGRYKADVTRTFPVNGRFSPLQREIYDIVLQANQQAISIIRPGVGLYEVHKEALGVVREGLFRLGLVTDPESAWQTQVWLMYNTNHWIGLHVHDVGGRGPSDGVGMKLRPGMVLTVEPGIYVGEFSLEILRSRLGRAGDRQRGQDIQNFIDKVQPAVEKYLNIGVRIEDDILVTETGHEVLSLAVPKDVAAVERLMKQDPRSIR
jgi:Xaa-Pro aminopeptidase